MRERIIISMKTIVGVRFRTAGKIYYFDPMELMINKGDKVVVETSRGLEFGTVVSGIRQVDEENIVAPLKPVLRIATDIDIDKARVNAEKEQEAYRVCVEKIKIHELDMKLIDVEYTFDNNKVMFYFTADGRIDFRDLVKDLAAIFRTRIELRQVGVRDETKIRGGIGNCGRSLCCSTHLSDFIPVSIKMAKEQNLSLNPTKISGVCGRLMCCLKHEEETYRELNKNLPNVGETVTLANGLMAQVIGVSVLRQRVKVITEINGEKNIEEIPVEALSFRQKGRTSSAKGRVDSDNSIGSDNNLKKKANQTNEDGIKREHSENKDNKLSGGSKKKKNNNNTIKNNNSKSGNIDRSNVDKNERMNRPNRVNDISEREEISKKTSRPKKKNGNKFKANNMNERDNAKRLIVKYDGDN